MHTQRQGTTTLITLLAVAGASCDTLPVAPEMSPATTVPGVGSDPALYQPKYAGRSAPHRFRFDVALMDQGARDLAAPILAQADRWTGIVHGTDLEDIEREPGLVRCGGLQFDLQETVLDDVLVMVSVQDYFPGSTTGIAVRICGYRESSKLPMIGAIFLDTAGLPVWHRNELILHAFGHMLGFGFSWDRLGLLQNSSWYDRNADTHFTGREAIAAFAAAGGANYRGNVVPLENDWANGGVDGHWRKSVFGSELMTSWLEWNHRDPISAITIQSLADIGYTVDLDQADAYTLPAANAVASAMGAGPVIHVSEEVVTSPAVFYDREGRVVRVVRN